MFQEIIQELTDNHDQIITEFQEKIDSIEPYYVLIAELISPTNIRLHIETEYDGGSIEGLCLKVMTLYVDNSKTHSKEDIKTLIETELKNTKKNLNNSFHKFQKTHDSSQKTNLNKSNLVNQQTFITTLLKSLPKSRKKPKSSALTDLTLILRKNNHV